MISEWFMNLGAMFGTWLAGLVPDWEAPSEIRNFDSTLNGFIAPFSGLGVWAPWGLLVFCVTTSFVVWLIGLGIKAIRVAVAHIPFFGGAG